MARRRLIYLAIQHKYTSMLVLLIGFWLLGGLTIWQLELRYGEPDSVYRDLPQVLRAVAICLTSGFDIEAPSTTASLVAFIGALIIGVITVGGLIACITSDLVNRLFFGIKIPLKPPSLVLEGHIVVIGWSVKSDRVIRELRAEVVTERPPIVIITPREERLLIPDTRAYEDVWTVHGEPTDDDVLDRADVAAARTILIVGEADDDREADAQSLLVSLAVTQRAPGVHTCVDVRVKSNLRHFRRTRVAELISVHEISENLLAQCAISRGISRVLHELITFQTDGNELYTNPIPAGWIERGLTLRHITSACLHSGILPVGIRNGSYLINPPRDRPFVSGDLLLSLCRRRLDSLEPIVVPTDEPT